MVYKTDSENDAFEVITDLTTIQSILQNLGAKTIKINSFDDVNVDFDDMLAGITTTGGRTPYSMAGGCEFKFNAILLYYSVYDLNDIYKQPIATNLFGIVFLDGGNSSGDYTLTPVVKKKSYKGQTGKNAYFGNSYSFRVNIKTLSVYDNTDARIEDNTTTTSIYSQDFNDVLSNLNRAIDIMNTNVQTTRAIQDSYMSIRADLIDLREQFNEYKVQIDNSISDKVSVAISEATEELKQYVEDELAKALAELESYDGGENAQDTIDDSEIIGASRLRKTTTKKVYTLGASAQT